MPQRTAAFLPSAFLIGAIPARASAQTLKVTVLGTGTPVPARRCATRRTRSSAIC
jgi:hypothetical protein